jgi:hypothetical protein
MDMDMQQRYGLAVWTWTSITDMVRCSMDMDFQYRHGHAAWTWTSSMGVDTQYELEHA